MRYLKTFESFGSDIYVFDIDGTLVKSPGLNEFLKDGLPDPNTDVGKVIDDFLQDHGMSRKDAKVVDDRVILPKEKAPSDWRDMAGGKMMPKPPKFFMTPESLGIDYYDEIKRIYDSVSNRAMLSGRIEDIRNETEEVLNNLGFKYPNEGVHLLPKGIENTTENIVDFKSEILKDFLNRYDKVFYYEDKLKWINMIRDIISDDNLILIHVKDDKVLGYY